MLKLTAALALGTAIALSTSPAAAGTCNISTIAGSFVVNLNRSVEDDYFEGAVADGTVCWFHISRTPPSHEVAITCQGASNNFFAFNQEPDNNGGFFQPAHILERKSISECRWLMTDAEEVDIAAGYSLTFSASRNSFVIEGQGCQDRHAGCQLQMKLSGTGVRQGD